MVSRRDRRRSHREWVLWGVPLGMIAIAGVLIASTQREADYADWYHHWITAAFGVLLALGLAFLGGLILNAMPCVFPILSLKVLSFATGDPGEHRRHGLAYLTGVVAAFILIASVLISLQSAGRWVGWGFQLQSTGFVIGLAYLFAVMGLSLSGLVLFGGRWMNLGAGLATAPGARDFSVVVCRARAHNQCVW